MRQHVHEFVAGDDVIRFGSLAEFRTGAVEECERPALEHLDPRVDLVEEVDRAPLVDDRRRGAVGDRHLALFPADARRGEERLLDPGSFVELDQLARHRAHGFGIEDTRPLTDGVITGARRGAYASVARPVFVTVGVPVGGLGAAQKLAQTGKGKATAGVALAGIGVIAIVHVCQCGMCTKRARCWWDSTSARAVMWRT